MPPAFLPLLLLLLLILPATHNACTLHQHCDDHLPTTIDFCLPTISRCLHYPSPISIRQQSPISLDTPTSPLAAQINLSTLVNTTNTPPLSLSNRTLTIRSMSLIYTHLNPNLPLQLIRHKTNITSLLTTFLHSPSLPTLTNLQFHQTLRHFTSLMRDRHSRYISPFPLAATVAILGFSVAPFFPTPPFTTHPPPSPRYIVNSVALGLPFNHPAFGIASEILTWDNLPIHLVLRRLARLTYGSNPPARLALALLALTCRQLAVDPLPPRSGADIEFRAADGRVYRVFVPWVYLDIRDLDLLRNVMRGDDAASGMDTMRVVERSGTPYDGVLSGRRAARWLGSVTVRNGARVEVPVGLTLQPFMQAEIVGTRMGRVGRIMFSSFGSEPFPEVIRDLRRVLSAMPRRGLIVDIRNNRGGNANIVKVFTELATGGMLDAQPTTIRANSFTRSLLFAAGSGDGDSGPGRGFPGLLDLRYRSAVRTALRAGEEFAGPGVNLYSELVAGRRERRAYFGPVVTVVNGRTFSGGDLFTAIQKDKKLSTIVGTDGNVGAGGAATVAYQLLAVSYPELLEALPAGIDFTTAFARYYRSGRNVGGLIESFGVVPDVRYFPSRADALDGDCDLIEFLAKGLVEGFENGTDGRRRRL